MAPLVTLMALLVCVLITSYKPVSICVLSEEAFECEVKQLHETTEVRLYFI